MAVGASVEKFVTSQREAISGFFGTEIPNPPDRLFVVLEKIRAEELFKAEAFYLPRRQLAEGMRFPGLKWPLDPWLYEQIREKRVAADSDCLPGQWVIVDVTERPKYQEGRQMYPDTSRFKKIMAGLRRGGQIDVPDDYRHVPIESRFAVSPDEIDGKGSYVAKAVAGIVGLQAGEKITTPTAAIFNYIGNLSHPELGQVNTSEWFSNHFGRGYRLNGGNSGHGGLSLVYDWRSDDRDDNFGFRLQVSFPSNP